MSGGSRSSGGKGGRARGNHYADMSCPALNTLANEFNGESTFYSYHTQSSTTENELVEERAEYKIAAGKSWFGLYPPEDLDDAAEEANKQKMLGSVVTNSWRMRGRMFNEARVYAWEVGFYTPEIDVRDRHNRRECILGGNFQNRMKKQDFFKEHFGPAYEFDNKMLWTERKNFAEGELVDNVCTIKKGQLGNTSEIVLTFKGVMHLNKMPKTEAERMANVLIVRPLMTKAKFRDVPCPGGKKWFTTERDGDKKVTINNSRGEPSLDILYGWKVVVQMVQGPNGSLPVLKVQRTTRMQITKTVGEYGKNIKERAHEAGLNFQAEAKERLLNRKAYAEYGNGRSMWIKQIRFDLNEKTMVEIGGKPTSIQDYFSRRYGVRVEDEPFLIMSSDRPGDDAYFPPSLFRLSARSSDAPQNYGQCLEHTALSPSKRLEPALRLLDRLRDALQALPLKESVEIAPAPLETPLFYLQNPIFRVTSKSGTGETKFNPSEMPGAWGRSTGGPYNYNDSVKLKSWSIVYDRNMEAQAKGVMAYAESYAGMRRLDLPTPNLRPVEFVTSVDREETYERFCKEEQQVIVFIIPDGTTGSVQKAMMTKAVQYSVEKNPHKPAPQLQSILSSNCGNKNAVLGMMANILLKCGNVLYKMDLPPSVKSLAKSTWAFGVDIAHNGRDKPSVLCIAGVVEPLIGTTRSWRPCCHMNLARQEVSSGRNVATLFEMLLTDINESLVEQGKKLNVPVGACYPEHVVIYRDGLAEDQLSEHIDEEISGIRTAISRFALRKKLSWAPSILCVVCPKQGVDDFCMGTVRNNQTNLATGGNPPHPAAVIHRETLSPSHIDFLLQGNPKDRKSKPKRYIVVRDDSGLTKLASGVLEIANYTLALTWGFAFALPFSTGNGGQPVPIKVAKHYAELMSQLLTRKDANVNRYRVSTASKNRPQMPHHQPLPVAVNE